MESQIISDICTLFSDHTLINRRNVTGDPHSCYRAKRDFLNVVFQSRVITAAMVVLGFSDKTSGPTKYPLPSNMDKMRKSQKLKLLSEISAKVVDTCFSFRFRYK